MTYTTTITEDHTLDTAIGITISATDPEGHNVRYSISSSSATDSALFRVDGMSGVLSLAHTLNYDDPDRQRMLSFTVSSGYIFFLELSFHNFRSMESCLALAGDSDFEQGWHFSPTLPEPGAPPATCSYLYISSSL